MPHDSRRLEQERGEARGSFCPAAEGRGGGGEGEGERASGGGRVGPGRWCAGRTQLGGGAVAQGHRASDTLGAHRLSQERPAGEGAGRTLGTATESCDIHLGSVGLAHRRAGT